MMFRPCTPRLRSNLVRWSAGLCIGSILLGPLAARSSSVMHAAEEASLPRLELPAVPMPQSSWRLSLAKDPFVPDAAEPPGTLLPNEVRDAAAPLIVEGRVGGHIEGRTPIDLALPLNRETSRPVDAFSDGSPVVALITGRGARALVTDRGRTRIVTVGDRLEGRRIIAITSRGIQLDDGSALALTQDPR